MNLQSQHIQSAIDRLASTVPGENRWSEACILLQELGFASFNMASVQTNTKGVNWVRSSMSESWLNRYGEKNFLSVDPIIRNAFKPVPTQLVHAGSMQRGQAPDNQSLALNHELKHAGYHTLASFQAFGNRAHEKKLIVLVSEHRLEASECAQYQRLAKVIGTFVDDIESNIVHVTTRNGLGSRLTGREIDVLTLLALGHRNDAIADRLCIAEITVRIHITSARRKLNARTREQALVNAIISGQICL